MQPHALRRPAPAERDPVTGDGQTRTIDDVIAAARAYELLTVMRWLRSEARIAYARRSFTEASTLQRAATRLETGIHRTQKV